MHQLDKAFDDFLDSIRAEFADLKGGIEEQISDAAEEVADEKYDGWFDAKALDGVADFLNRVRPSLPNHFIQELDGLLRDMDR